MPPALTHRRTHVILLLALLVLGDVELATGASPKHQARRLFRQGTTLYRKGNLEGALEKFREARAVYSSYRIDLNIAAVLVDLKRLPQAAQSFEAFLERAEGSRRAIRVARRKLAALKKQLGRLRIVCPTAAAHFEIDGQDKGEAKAWIYLLPGPHEVKACLAGHECVSKEVTLAAGEERVLEHPGPAPPVAAPPAVTSPKPPSAPASTTEEPRRPSWRLTAGWITVGTGAAALLTGVVFGAMVSSKTDDHAEAAAEGRPFGEQQEIASTGRTYEKVELVALIAGGVAIAGGVGLLLWHYLGEDTTRGDRAAFIAPVVTGQVRGIAGGFSF